MKSKRLSRTEQCAKCPWRRDVDPHEIPNGYSEEKHRALKSTISSGEFHEVLAAHSCGLRVMACHEAHEDYCIGWLMNQLGPGNNIGLRIAMIGCENLKDVKLHGPQHRRFEETLPEI